MEPLSGNYTLKTVPSLSTPLQVLELQNVKLTHARKIPSRVGLGAPPPVGAFSPLLLKESNLVLRRIRNRSGVRFPDAASETVDI